MFTGIITDLGKISYREAINDSLRLSIDCNYDMSFINIGASIAADGVCLTVVAKQKHGYTVEVSNETLSKTTLGEWQVGRQVNLERPIQAGGEFGGHFVTGHVDATGHVLHKESQDNFHVLTVAVPKELQSYFVPKGSVAINGVSLTVNTVNSGHIGVMLIPHTAQHTNLGMLLPQDRVNLEIDLIARYIAPYLQK